MNKILLKYNTLNNSNMQQFEFNSKITKGFCLQNPSHPLKKKRCDAKFCSGRCRKQYELERNEKGFVKHAFKGTEPNLYVYYSNMKSSLKQDLLFNLKCKPDLEKIEKAINVNGLTKSWYADIDDFRLEYIAHNPKNPFEIYFSESKWNFIQICTI